MLLLSLVVTWVENSRCASRLCRLVPGVWCLNLVIRLMVLLQALVEWTLLSSLVSRSRTSRRTFSFLTRLLTVVATVLLDR